MGGRWLSVPLLSALWPIAACVVALAAFNAIGDTFLASYVLDLGSLGLPNIRHTCFLFYWTLLGSLAAFFLIVGLKRLLALAPAGAAATGDERAASRWTWIGITMAAAFAIAWAVRTFVLRGAALTDDESAYRFTAQLLATGRLWTPSHPLKAFFDRAFMINDGKFYGQYFVGWSALMVPGVYVGATGYMNAVYSALTVPALYSVVRRLAGSAAGRVATLLYLASPMLMVGAATEMAHQSCMMALAWSIYFLLRAQEEPAAWWTHAGVAFFFSLAFMVRPISALGVGLPVVIWWLVALTRWPANTRRVALLSFAAPTLVMAALFLGVNVAQNGSPFVASYARLQDYMREVNYRNVGWSPQSPPLALRDYILPNREVGRALAATTVALVRLVFDLFGSPLCVVLVGLAWAVRSARLAWLSALSYVLVHFFLSEAGIDSYGPVHFYEMSLPLLLLCGIGFARLVVLVGEWRPAAPASWPLAIVASLVLVSLVGFAPVRLDALKRIASNVNAPADAVREARISNAVIFTTGFFAPQECITPTRHFVLFRPNNDPDLKNDVLWVNHLGWEQDHQLMRYFPDRVGYLLTWSGCRAQLMKL
ncbi:MAG TPA: glycosyltransferase family 39 protein [Vicinamibacterales bacterium]|jgi:hypothetical protein